MEQLLDDNHIKSQHQGKGNRLRVKRNYDRNSLLLHSARLHKLSKQLFQLKVIKSNNRTTAQFFSTTCYRRLKIPKRRRQFNAIRVAILFLLSFFIYLYWKQQQQHRTLFVSDERTAKEENVFKQYRTSDSPDSYLENINLKQIDETKATRRPTNRQDDQKDLEKDLERQHLFSDRTRSRTNNDRSSSKLDFNTQHAGKLIREEDARQAANGQINVDSNKEIKNEPPTSNNDHRRTSSSVSSTRRRLPAHQQTAEAILNPQFKNYSFLGKALVSKSNQSSSISTIFPVEQRTNGRSILEKQLAWYELVGITMFNLLGSSLAREPSASSIQNSNKKLANARRTANATVVRTTETTKIQSNRIETTLSRPSSVDHGVKHDTRLLNEQLDTESNSDPTLKNHFERRLPQCIIIGVRKAGTRAVLEYLTLNDQIKKADNEVHFFDNDERYAFGLDYYRNQMPLTASGQIITIEKSPAYFVTATVPERIKAMNASIKLILIIRDPVIRLISDYTQLLHNKLLKLDDLMRTSGGLNRQPFEEQQKPNHLFKFPIDKEKQQKNVHLEKQEQQPVYELTSRTTNEQSAFVVASGGGGVGEQRNNSEQNEKKIEKRQQQHINFPATTDYWNRIGSEPDYRKTDQLDEVVDEQEDDTFVSLPIVKRQLQDAELNKISNWSTMSNEERNRIGKSIDFNKHESNRTSSKLIDSTRTSKLKSTMHRNVHETFGKQLRTKPIRKRKINRQRADSKSKANRISREANQNTDEEDEQYKTYRELNADDEDMEPGAMEYSDSEKKMRQSTHQPDRLKQQSTMTTIEQVMRNREDDEDDYHNWNIPRFEELVIRNGEVNTNYKPVKTSIYSLYMDNWLKVFRRDQIHIVNGDKLISEPHVELNKIETFLGLPNQIRRNQFVFNLKKNFFCARMHPASSSIGDHSLNSSTSWRQKTRIAAANKKNLNSYKTTGRHSSIRCLNSSKGRKHPQVAKQVLSKLRQFYAPFNRHFERLVGMQFNWPEI